MAGAVIANVLLWSSTPYYDVYTGIPGVDAAEDQSLAGAVWMIEGSVVTIGVLGWLFVRWMTQGEAAQELVEHAARHGVELDPARARRAVAAGAGERLRSRLEHGAEEQDEPDQHRDHEHHVDQEAERLPLAPQRVQHLRPRSIRAGTACCKRRSTSRRRSASRCPAPRLRDAPLR